MDNSKSAVIFSYIEPVAFKDYKTYELGTGYVALFDDKNKPVCLLCRIIDEKEISSFDKKALHRLVLKNKESFIEVTALIISQSFKVVDKEAYTYEEPVYETIAMNVCNDCGADVTNATVRKEHMLYEIKNDGKGSYKCVHKNVQVDTKTVTVPEQSHYETKVVKEAWSETVVVKEAWTEKVLVKEAGWY